MMMIGVVQIGIQLMLKASPYPSKSKDVLQDAWPPYTNMYPIPVEIV
jgi:hypothetical protein